MSGSVTWADIMREVAGLSRTLWWLSIVITAVVWGIGLYAIWRFRASRNPRAANFSHNTKLELGWTLLPVLIVLFLALWSVRVLGMMGDVPEDALRVTALGHQFYWEFQYPEYGFSVPNQLVVPAGRPVAVDVTAGDVIHAFWVPDFGVKQDAVPGITRTVWFTPDRPDLHKVSCAELCGAGHYTMLGTVRVLSPEGFAAWLAQQRQRAGAAGRSHSAAGGGSR